MPPHGPTHGVLPAIRQVPGLTGFAGVPGGMGACAYITTGATTVVRTTRARALQRVIHPPASRRRLIKCFSRLKRHHGIFVSLGLNEHMFVQEIEASSGSRRRPRNHAFGSAYEL